MATTLLEQYNRARSYLNRAIYGPNTNAILYGIANSVGVNLENLVQAANAQFRISTASGSYLDDLLSGYGVERPPLVGISDDVFRAIGIAVINQKQIRTLLNTLLNIFYGNSATKAFSQSGVEETYNLAISNPTLILEFDGGTPVTVLFLASDFQYPSAATAQEVCDAISKSFSSQGIDGVAFTNLDTTTNLNSIVIQSNTIGPSSSIRVLGGNTQNIFKFDTIRPTTATATTTWSVELSPIDSRLVRYTNTGGTDPSLWLVNAGDYANIWSPSFATHNKGSFPIVDVGFNGSTYYFDVANPLFNPSTDAQSSVTQGDLNTLFFNPTKNSIISQLVYAAFYQTSTQNLQFYLPAITQVVFRNRIGAAFLDDDSDTTDLGPYVYNPAQSFTISSTYSTLTSAITPTSGRLLNINSANFPDSSGYIVLDFGTAYQEVVPYIAAPEPTQLLLSPFATLQYSHSVGADVTLLSSNQPVVLASDGSDYQFYVTDVADAVTYSQTVLQSVLAAGINAKFNITYPSDIGLALAGTPYSSKYTVWGGDAV